MNPIHESLRLLKNREKELSTELNKIKNAISALEKSSKMIRVNRTVIQMKCETCKKVFSAKKKNTRFCSAACRSNYHRKEEIKKSKPTTLLKGDPLKASSSSFQKGA